MRLSRLSLLGSLLACGATTTVAPPDAAAPDLPTETFAIQKVYLGEATREGVRSNQAWKSFGYNLDGKATLATSNDACKRAPGAPSSNQVDGNNGIDNAFGAVLLPLLQSALSLDAPSTAASADFAAGHRTYQISIKGLGDDPKQTTHTLSGGVFPSLAYLPFPGAAPTTDWPVRVEGLADGATIAGGPRFTFGQAWIADGTFVGEGNLDLTVVMAFAGAELTFVIHHAIVTFVHPAPDTATNGVLAGVLDTEEFILGFKSAAGRISTALCGTQFDGIAQQVRQAADIMLDLSNVTGTSCNAISIGLGFEAARVGNPTKIASEPLPVPPNPCP